MSSPSASSKKSADELTAEFFLELEEIGNRSKQKYEEAILDFLDSPAKTQTTSSKNDQDNNKSKPSASSTPDNNSRSSSAKTKISDARSERTSSSPDSNKSPSAKGARGRESRSTKFFSDNDVESDSGELANADGNTREGKHQTSYFGRVTSKDPSTRSLFGDSTNNSPDTNGFKPKAPAVAANMVLEQYKQRLEFENDVKNPPKLENDGPRFLEEFADWAKDIMEQGISEKFVAQKLRDAVTESNSEKAKMVLRGLGRKDSYSKILRRLQQKFAEKGVQRRANLRTQLYDTQRKKGTTVTDYAQERLTAYEKLSDEPDAHVDEEHARRQLLLMAGIPQSDFIFIDRRLRKEKYKSYEELHEDLCDQCGSYKGEFIHNKMSQPDTVDSNAKDILRFNPGGDGGNNPGGGGDPNSGGGNPNNGGNNTGGGNPNNPNGGNNPNSNPNTNPANNPGGGNPNGWSWGNNNGFGNQNGWNGGGNWGGKHGGKGGKGKGKGKNGGPKPMCNHGDKCKFFLGKALAKAQKREVLPRGCKYWHEPGALQVMHKKCELALEKNIEALDDVLALELTN
jgi:hypothetical protein